MNENIRRLLAQAYLEQVDIRDTTKIAEKFAELIVRECAEVVKPTQHHEVWAQSYLGGVDGLDLLYSKIKDIKEHFGVEE